MQGSQGQYVALHETRKVLCDETDENLGAVGFRQQRPECYFPCKFRVRNCLLADCREWCPGTATQIRCAKGTIGCTELRCRHLPRKLRSGTTSSIPSELRLLCHLLCPGRYPPKHGA